MRDPVNRLYSADGAARLKGGEDFDVSYELLPDRSTRMRFRVNATAILTRGDDGAAIVARTLPSKAPALAELGIEPAILAAFQPGDGIVIAAGGTGNGKSTLLAAMTRAMLEDPNSNRAILEYSAPIEFVFDDIQGASATIEQSEVPRHLPSFPAGIRNAMRRAPSAIIVGECRDAETITAAVDAAITQHAVYTTIAARHAYVATAMMSVLTLAREQAGVLAPAQFAFLKLIDRRLWYALHSLGFPGSQNRAEQPNPRIEALGARDHWAAEMDAGQPLQEPSLERALDLVRNRARSSALNINPSSEQPA